MPTWLQIFIALGGGTLLGLIVADIYNKIKKSTKGYKEMIQQKEDERVVKLATKVLNDTILSEIRNDICQIKINVSNVDSKINTIEKDITVLKEGTQASLRNGLYRIYNECVDKGYADIDERENFINMYEKYHNLCVNGVMDDIKQKFLSLPTFKTTQDNKKKSGKQRLVD